MNNPQTPKILFIDHTERTADGYGSYLKVYCTTGETYRVAEKRNALWEVFESCKKYEALLAIFETYKNTEYIVDAKKVADELTQTALNRLGEQIADKGAEDRNRSTALSYAKDMVIGDKLSSESLFDQAQKNYNFIKGR